MCITIHGHCAYLVNNLSTSCAKGEAADQYEPSEHLPVALKRDFASMRKATDEALYVMHIFHINFEIFWCYFPKKNNVLGLFGNQVAEVSRNQAWPTGHHLSCILLLWACTKARCMLEHSKIQQHGRKSIRRFSLMTLVLARSPNSTSAARTCTTSVTQ